MDIAAVLESLHTEMGPDIIVEDFNARHITWSPTLHEHSGPGRLRPRQHPLLMDRKTWRFPIE